MSTLICGSIAFDNIMQFEGAFSDHFLPNQLHNLNVAFLVPSMRREFGGCAGNIAYALKTLGDEALIMATVGDDASIYLNRLDALALSRRCVLHIPNSFTAQAFITTDSHNNQITAFHPGAMGQSHLNHIADAGVVQLAIVAPDGREGMLQHARECVEANVPFIFDPGQGLPMFNGTELAQFIEQASYAAVNEYEASLLSERTGQSMSQLATHLKALIVTLGEKGAHIYVDGKMHAITPPKPDAVLDPTGCGDAFRGGLLYGIKRNFDWETIGRLACLMGSIKIAHRGGQNYQLTQSEIRARFQAAYGYTY